MKIRSRLLRVFSLALVVWIAALGQALAESGAAAPPASAESLPKIDFHEALSRALSKSPDYDTLVRTRHNAQLTERNAWSALLPTVDLQASHQYADLGGSVPSTAVHAPWSNFFAVNVNENLYDNGETWRQAEIARLNQQIGGLNLEKGRLALLLKVASAFYDFSSAFAGLELQKNQIDTLRQQFRSIEARFHQGLSSNRDFLRIKAQLQRSEVGLASQELTLAQTRQTLRLAIGEREAVDFVALGENHAAVERVTYHEVRPEDTLDYRIARAQDDISEIRFKTAVRNDLPRLSLKAGYSYDVPEYLGARIAGLDDPYWNLSASLVLDYSLWDWGIRHRNVEIADNQKQIEFDTQNTVRITVNQALVQSKQEILLLQRSYRESQQIMKDDQAVYDSLNRAYREGKATYIDLITALGDLYSSRSQNLTLQFSLLKAQANLAFYEGTLDDVLKNQ